MDVSEARSLLEAGGFAIKSEQRLGNDTGAQLRLKNGAIVANRYNPRWRSSEPRIGRAPLNSAVR